MERKLDTWVLRNGADQYDEEFWGVDIYSDGEYLGTIMHVSVEDLSIWNDEELVIRIQALLDRVQ